MEEIFGIEIKTLMFVLLGVFIAIMVSIIFTAIRNPVLLKLGLRNIPRRPAQTGLIIIGSMLSAVIIAAAFGTGDSIHHSIRNVAIDGLGNIDEVITLSDGSESFGSPVPAYFSMARFQGLKNDLESSENIDGLMPQVVEIAGVTNPHNSLFAGRTNVVGISPYHMDGFKDFIRQDKEKVFLSDLAPREIFINEILSSELDAIDGNTLRLFVNDVSVDLIIRATIQVGGLAGIEPTIVMPLTATQMLFQESGKINAIAVSNKGDATDGAQGSQETIRELRMLFADPLVANKLRLLLKTGPILNVITGKLNEKQIDTELQTDLRNLIVELEESETSSELIRIVSDQNVMNEIALGLNTLNLYEEERRIDVLLRDLSDMKVEGVKKTLLDLANLIGSTVTSFFLVMGLFSVMVGSLLVFLIFVMLAAARRTEMGIFRAIGAQRTHLIQIFVFEGTTYNLIASAVGTVVGFLLTFVIVKAAGSIFGSDDDGFALSYHVELSSVVVAYCLSMLIMFATVGFSAYRVSRMNIIEAVRDLPESTNSDLSETLHVRAIRILHSLIRPFTYVLRSVRHVFHKRFVNGLLNFCGFLLWIIVFPIWVSDILWAILRLIWPFFKQGWLIFLFGTILMLFGVLNWSQTAPFTIGFSLMIIGLGLVLRQVCQFAPQIISIFGILVATIGISLIIYATNGQELFSGVIGSTVLLMGMFMIWPAVRQRSHRSTQIVDRLAFSFIGILGLAFWITPFDIAEPITGELEAEIEMFFISGVAMVAAAVWTIMHNADLLLRMVSIVSNKIGRLRPVILIAVAYPLSAKFRTGLTLAMFSLVVFTLVVMSILGEAFSSALEDSDEVTGHWDIEGTIASATDDMDIGHAISEADLISESEFDAIGSYVRSPVKMRQFGAENQRWDRFVLQPSDHGFLGNTEHKVRVIAKGYGTTEANVWSALIQDPNLAVIGAGAVPDDGGPGGGQPGFKIEGISFKDKTMNPIDVRVLDPVSNKEWTYTIIGILDYGNDSENVLVTSKSKLEKSFGFTIPSTIYRFRAVDGINLDSATKNLETTFIRNGMETVNLQEKVRSEAAQSRAFNRLFTAYMGLGLIVGIAALGVISLRSVVERRQQIGTLRAIGYRKWMVQWSFVIESSFVALLGIFIGLILGGLTSYNIIVSIREGFDGIEFSIPFAQISIIVALAYIFSILTTLLAARQASEIAPSDALRYE